MTLAGEAEVTRNLDEQASLGNELLCQANAFVKNVSVRCRFEGVCKYPEKLPWAELDYLGKIEQAQRAIEICMYVIH